MRSSRRIHSVALLGWAGLLGGCAGPASTSLPDGALPYFLPGTATHTLASAFVGDTFQVIVSVPSGYDEATRSYPVVVALDADLAFAATAQVIRLMQLRDELPPSVVIGVGYGDVATARRKRVRDLTPTSPAGDPRCASPAMCGGAERFLRFLRQEMLPFVADRYRIHTEGATLVGASLGGLFGGFVVARHPEVFADYVLGSPTVAWDDHWLLHHLAEGPWGASSASGRVFIGVGGAEGDGVEAATRLARALRRVGPVQRSVILDVFEGEKHMSVQPMVLSRGLRVLADGPGTRR